MMRGLLARNSTISAAAGLLCGSKAQHDFNKFSLKQKNILTFPTEIEL